MKVCATPSGFAYNSLLLQREGLEDGLDSSSMEEIQGWLRNVDTEMGGVQRELGEKERTIVGKRQLIEANKGQYSKVCVLSICPYSHGSPH